MEDIHLLGFERASVALDKRESQRAGRREGG